MNKDFNNWDPNYDIPDDPKPIDEEINISPFETLQSDIFYKEEMKEHIEKLRRRAMDLRKKQNDYWDDYGDNYNLEELIDFILDNKEYVIGVVKNATWLVKLKKDKWDYDFKLYYDTLLAFIERSKYVISAYENQIKKLRRGI